MALAGVLVLDWDHLSARRVDAPASPLDDPLDTPAAQVISDRDCRENGVSGLTALGVSGAGRSHHDRHSGGCGAI